MRSFFAFIYIKLINSENRLYYYTLVTFLRKPGPLSINRFSFIPPSQRVYLNFFLSLESNLELLQAIRSIKNKSSWSTVVLKSLINVFFEPGVFSECLKTVIVILLCNGDKIDISGHYRQIAMLPVVKHY